MRAFEFLLEADKPKVGRELQHAEDLVIVDGSAGALEALDNLEAMSHNVDDVTIKWDGSPAVYFGRDEQGAFILTDKSGFLAKGYEGKVKSAGELQNMLLGRGKMTPDDARKQFAGNMANLWDRFEAITDKSFRGYMFGDMLFFSQPGQQDGDYQFKPNTVTYNIPTDSDLGKRISNSTAGIVVHHFQDLAGNKHPIKGPIKGIRTNGEVLVVGPTTVTKTPDVSHHDIDATRQYIQNNAAAIDALLDDSKLAAIKMTDFKNILYKFVNQQVKTRDLTNLTARFDKWLETSGVSGPKQTKIQEFRKSQSRAFDAVFSTLEQIMHIKDAIIDQLDDSSPVKASIGGQRGGEGYVKGNIKLVPRTKFTAANVEKHS